ncbi:phage integrase SAM-like domain-containing protein [Dysgonomonas sp. UBA7710]|uniref:phage integrase SAM-like domain-containing protein n=1 Tax=Dysgonomonas sp. UBA7710 TaxID=1946428 RepID=UPI0039C85924
MVVTKLVYQFERHNAHYSKLVPSVITVKTYSRYKLTLSRLIEFMQSQYGISDIQLSKVTLEFIELFFSFLKEKHLCSYNTATIFIQRFRSVVNYAAKTHQPAYISLLKIPLQILEKYKRQYNDEPIFPINSNQKMNEYLKETAVI